MLQDARFGALQLGRAHACGAVDNLALQVAVVHHVEIHDADAAHARRRQVQRQRRAQPARADQQHAAALQLLLPSMPTSGTIRWRL